MQIKCILITLFVLIFIKTNSIITKSICFDGIWEHKTWIPKNESCTLKKFSLIETQKCLDNKRIVFGGNSVSRHFFLRLLSTLNGIKHDNITQEYRIQEKLKFSYCSDIEKLEDLNAAQAICGNETIKRYGKFKDLCIYNMDHLKETCYQNWSSSYRNDTNNIYKGSLSFTWLYNWYSPFIEEQLSIPNTIVSTNAGVNYAWASNSGWELNSSTVVVANQFPMIWNNNKIHETSRFIYRQTTGTCDRHIAPQISLQNDIIKTHVDNNNNNNNGQFMLLELDKPTRERHHYIDCNHHPGEQTDLHIKMFLNSICD